jgi:hypothetical protein
LPRMCCGCHLPCTALHCPALTSWRQSLHAEIQAHHSEHRALPVAAATFRYTRLLRMRICHGGPWLMISRPAHVLARQQHSTRHRTARVHRFTTVARVKSHCWLRSGDSEAPPASRLKFAQCASAVICAMIVPWDFGMCVAATATPWPVLLQQLKHARRRCHSVHCSIASPPCPACPAPAATRAGDVADDMEADLMVVSCDAVHSKRVDANLLAEFVPCPVMLLP